ncbi:putative Lipocalin-like domain-containing protein [Seiridium unicorne]|uniref:Lipocalin-like domain-containing protein n=1 Tax=Seiridium unicorne TaxID=138068 RepID=A0ABR2V6R6_9PEZI
MRAQIFSVPVLAALAAGSPTRSISRATNTTADGINPAIYDGSCFYPVPDPIFPGDLSEYLGRWYQVAGTPFLFTAGCQCTTADYGLNDDGTVSVLNSCQIFGIIPNEINGSASIVDSKYGSKGVFQVSFPIIPGGGVTCPGPNYIVQKYDPNWAIVQSPSWGELFILSRVQNPSEADLNAWIAEAVALGTDASLIEKVTQSNCTAS